MDIRQEALDAGLEHIRGYAGKGVVLDGLLVLEGDRVGDVRGGCPQNRSVAPEATKV